jgi:hypothetical protein
VSELELLKDARSSLERARSLSDVKAILDVAIAAKKYAEAKKLGEESLAYAQEIINRATRRMGEMLAETPKHEGGRPPETSNNSLPVLPPPTLKTLGVTRMQSSRAQQLAKIPEEVFEQSVSRPQNRLLRVARDIETQEARAAADATPIDLGDVRIEHCSLSDLELEADSVDLIFTDPPYPAEFIPLWSDLGELAAKALKPGGLLVAYSGQMFLPEAMSRLAVHLDYWWTYAITHVGAFFQLRVRHTQVGWKPVLVYRKPGGVLPPWVNDIVTDGAREKSGHDWQQSEAEAAYWIDKLTDRGGLVVDPFLGSGTTAAVARRLGRRFVGCDVDPLAVSRTKERLT